MLSTPPIDAEDWRPSPEVYKISSNRERHLRNKIRASNNRVRSKGEYRFCVLKSEYARKKWASRTMSVFRMLFARSVPQPRAGRASG